MNNELRKYTFICIVDILIIALQTARVFYVYCLHMKFHMPRYSYSLFIPIESQLPLGNFRMPSILLRCISCL